MANTRTAIVDGIHNGEMFTCGLLFHFDPLTCTRAAPKVEKLFLHKTFDTCQRIARDFGFSLRLLPAIEEKEYGEHPGVNPRHQ